MEREESRLRAGDVRMSNEIYSFLDNTFYKEKTTDFERVNDRERQLKGIDVIFKIGDKKYKADEKAAVRWRNLKTYSLEVSFINRRNEVQEGWFVNEDLENNSYVFVWVDKDGEEESVTLAVVLKKKLHEYLQSIGWGRESLLNKSRLIREGNTNLGDININGCKFSYSERLVEKPVNILLPREKYMKLADLVWTKKLN